MNLQCIAEHTVDLSLIKRDSKALDLGCRAFSWSKAMLEYVDHVYCVDADGDFISNKPPGKGYSLFLGAVYDIGGLNLALHRSGNGTGNYVTPVTETYMPDSIAAKSFTLKQISDIYNVSIWDVIKFDIEGSEIPVLMSLNEPPAKQITCEFHMHTGTPLWQVKACVSHLETLGYEMVFCDYSRKHGLPENFWDCLFILK